MRDEHQKYLRVLDRELFWVLRPQESLLMKDAFALFRLRVLGISHTRPLKKEPCRFCGFNQGPDRLHGQRITCMEAFFSQLRKMAVSILWRSRLWVSLQQEPYYLGSILGPLILEISQITSMMPYTDYDDYRPQILSMSGTTQL